MSKTKYEIDGDSIRFHAKLTWSEWKNLGAIVGSTVRVGPWLVGDWVNFGESRFGEKYTQALDVTSLSVERLRVCAWISSRFPPADRRSSLSFESHREVASLNEDERKHWLDLAEQNKWGSKDLRMELRQANAGNRIPSSTLRALFLFTEPPDEEDTEDLIADLYEIANEYHVELKVKR